MKSPYFTEDHDLFRQTVRDFIEKEVVPNTNEWEAQQDVPRSIWTRMGELGFLGINYPEAYGGAEADFFYSVVFIEELSRSFMAGFPAAINVHQYMATAHLAAAGSQELKQKYLSKAISGEFIAALGVSEPNAGSDVAGMHTTAVREGDHYVINGSKIFITNGVNANFVVVACKTNPQAGVNGISLIIVDRDTPGFTTNKLDKLGWHSSDTGELFFDNVKVPASNIIGEEGKGFFYIMDSFQLERLVAAVASIAGAQHTIEITLQYMNERKAFGRPINKFQALRHLIADLQTEVDAAHQYTHYVAWLYSQGEFAVRECSQAKLLTSEVGKKAADVCLQCFGGYGFMEEYPIARMYRDARVGTIVGGTSQIMKEIIAKVLIDGTSYERAYKAEGSATNNNNTSSNGNGAANTLTAKEIILSLPKRYRPEKAATGYTTSIHFNLVGNTGGQFTVNINNGNCEVQEGHHGEATCTVQANANDYEDVELGRSDAQTAVMMGKIQLSNISEMMTFSRLFKKVGS